MSTYKICIYYKIQIKIPKQLFTLSKVKQYIYIIKFRNPFDFSFIYVSNIYKLTKTAYHNHIKCKSFNKMNQKTTLIFSKNKPMLDNDINTIATYVDPI